MSEEKRYAQDDWLNMVMKCRMEDSERTRRDCRLMEIEAISQIVVLCIGLLLLIWFWVDLWWRS